MAYQILPNRTVLPTLLAALCLAAALSISSPTWLSAAEPPAGNPPPATGGSTPATDQQPPEKAPSTQPPELVEKITVTSTLAKERQDPATFTSISRDQIRGKNRGQDLALLLAETPNAYAYSDSGNGVGYSYLRIRGFDQRRIAVNVNGIPLNTPETHQVYFIDLADLAGGLDRLQVQRGTGTALFGSPAVGGVVNLETGHLPAEPNGELRLGGGSWGTHHASLEYGAGITGTRWAYRVRAARVTSDGYRDHAWTRHTQGSLALERFGERSLLRINLFGGPEKTQLSYYGVDISHLRGQVTGNVDRDRRANPMRPGETDTYFQPHLQVLHDLILGDHWTLNQALYLILGDGYYRQYSSERDYVTSFDPTGYPTSSIALAEVWRKRWVGQQQSGWIPRLSYQHQGGRLTLGAEARLHHAHHLGTITSSRYASGPEQGQPAPAGLVLYDYRNRKETFSVFAREALTLTPALTLELELQATTHKYSMTADQLRGLGFDARYSFVTPRVGFNWNVNSNWNVYASASTAGSDPAVRDIWDQQDPWIRPRELFDTASADQKHFSHPKAKAEKLRAWEAGVGFTGSKVQFKANIYRMDFRDELVPAGGLDDDGNLLTTNAARSIHQGVELQGAANLPLGLHAAGWLSISRDENKELLLYGSPGFTADYSGNRTALFPDHLAQIELSKGFGKLQLAATLRRVGTIYLDNSENERKNPSARLAPDYVDKKLDPFTLVDIRAVLDIGALFARDAHQVQWEFRAENLLDRRYTAFGYAYPDGEFKSFYAEFFPGVPRSLYSGLIVRF